MPSNLQEESTSTSCSALSRVHGLPDAHQSRHQQEPLCSGTSVVAILAVQGSFPFSPPFIEHQGT